MPTPITAFADAAAKYGGVDPNDMEAVEEWFTQELPTLPVNTIEEVLHGLLQQDGVVAEREITPVYPKRAPLPSLRSSPESASPLVAEKWKTLLRKLLGRPKKR